MLDKENNTQILPCSDFQSTVKACVGENGNFLKNVNFLVKPKLSRYTSAQVNVLMRTEDWVQQPPELQQQQSQQCLVEAAPGSQL